MNDSLLPDGREFAFWDDATRYTCVYHVRNNTRSVGRQ